MGVPLNNGTRTALYGTSEVALDRSSGRFNVPSDMDQLKGETVQFTRDPLGRFLEVRRRDDYIAFASRMEAVAATLDLEAADAILVDYVGFTIQALVDNNLRLIIPKRMRETLGDTASIVLVGVGDALQIWPAKTYNDTKAQREQALRAAFGQIGKSILLRQGVAGADDAAVGGAA